MTPQDALDEMCTLINTAWVAGAATANGSSAAPLILWPNTDEGTEPPVDDCWARVSVQHTDGEQCTMGPGGSNGGRRFERNGILTVQVFQPLGEGVTRGLALATLALNSFEGVHTPGGVWFRRCRIDHVGRTRTMDMTGRERPLTPDPWDQIQALGDFTYYETK